MNVPPFVSWALVGLGFFLAVFLTYHEERMKAVTAVQEREREKFKKQSVVRPPRGKLTAHDRGVIWNLSYQMEYLHGHDDPDGIKADYQNNIDTDTILERKCTLCGKPRNKMGGYV